MSTSTADGPRVMDLQGQWVVILGGTSGIGLATAKAAARGGAEVTVISRRPASIDRALAELPVAGAGLLIAAGAIHLDLHLTGHPAAVRSRATTGRSRARTEASADSGEGLAILA